MKSLHLPFGPLDRRIVSMARDAQPDIQPGQCFKRNGIVWRVAGLTTINNISHVEIMQVGDPTELKLISVSTLRDDYEYCSGVRARGV